jgi:hypothetical protein
MPRLLLRLWARAVPLIYRGRWEAELVALVHTPQSWHAYMRRTTEGRGR